MAPITVAVNRKFKDSQTGQLREDATFVDVVLFGRQAEVAGQYLSKGRPVLVEGRLRLERWDDKETGKPRSRLRVVGSRLQFLGSRAGSSGSQGERPPVKAGGQGVGGEGGEGSEEGLIPVGRGVGESEAEDVEEDRIPF